MCTSENGHGNKKEACGPGRQSVISKDHYWQNNWQNYLKQPVTTMFMYLYEFLPEIVIIHELEMAT